MATQKVETTLIDDLVQKAANLDPDALGAIAEQYAARLYGFVYRLTGHANDSEELVQEVFVKLMRNIRSYQHDGRFDAWLFTIATNVVRDFARRRQRQPAQADFEHVVARTQDARDNGRNPRPEARIELDDEAKRLEVALGTLPSAEREVILLRHYGELDFAEIARIMGTPLGTALARSHRGLAKLRTLME